MLIGVFNTTTGTILESNVVDDDQLQDRNEIFDINITRKDPGERVNCHGRKVIELCQIYLLLIKIYRMFTRP